MVPLIVAITFVTMRWFALMYSESYWDLIPLHDEHPRQIALKSPQSYKSLTRFYVGFLFGGLTLFIIYKRHYKPGRFITL